MFIIVNTPQDKLGTFKPFQVTSVIGAFLFLYIVQKGWKGYLSI